MGLLTKSHCMCACTQGGISGIQGPVQMACQLLNKRDSIIFIEEEIIPCRNDFFHTPLHRGSISTGRRASSGAGEIAERYTPISSSARKDAPCSRLSDRSLELWSQPDEFNSVGLQDWASGLQISFSTAIVVACTCVV